MARRFEITELLAPVYHEDHGFDGPRYTQVRPPDDPPSEFVEGDAAAALQIDAVERLVDDLRRDEVRTLQVLEKARTYARRLASNHERDYVLVVIEALATVDDPYAGAFIVEALEACSDEKVRRVATHRSRQVRCALGERQRAWVAVRPYVESWLPDPAAHGVLPSVGALSVDAALWALEAVLRAPADAGRALCLGMLALFGGHTRPAHRFSPEERQAFAGCVLDRRHDLLRRDEEVVSSSLLRLLGALATEANYEQLAAEVATAFLRTNVHSQAASVSAGARLLRGPCGLKAAPCVARHIADSATIGRFFALVARDPEGAAWR